MRIILAALVALLSFSTTAFAQIFTGLVVATCGTPGITYTTGKFGPFTVDTNGNLCNGSSGGGTQAVNVTQWASVILGAATAWGIAPTGNVPGVNASVLASALPTGAATQTTLAAILAAQGAAPSQQTGATVGLVAGAAIVGKVGIDQTTPGTTNGVQIVAALPAGTALVGKVGIDQTTPGTTNAVQPTTSGDIIINPSNSFVRPGNTTPYASGQLVANSVIAGSVVPLTWTASRIATGNFRVSRAHMTLSGKSITNTNFRLHLFNATTTVSNGDGATFVPTLAANEVCEMDITIALAGADVSTGYGAANQGTACDVALASGSALFGLIEARAAYTPVSGETVLVVLEIHQN